MNCTTQIEGTKGTLRLEGRFTFEVGAAFRAQASALLDAHAVTELLLDCTDLTHLDASALGIFLLLREQAEVAGARVVLQSPSPAVRAIFDAVQFGNLFEIRA